MLLEYNLQFFAKEGLGGEKTEPASEKKLREARDEGQVAKSREIANGLGLLALFLVLRFYTGYMGTSFLALFSNIYNRMPGIVTFWNGNMSWEEMGNLYEQMVIQILLLLYLYLK